MIRIFQYIPEIDAFIVDPTYRYIADELGLSEWHEAVWIGRYFALDNDFGEHWMDNWDQRDERAAQAQALGIAYEEIMVINPERFTNNQDGPCHTNEQRKKFWTDVLTSLQLSLDLIILEAQQMNEQRKQHNRQDYLPDLAQRIEKVKLRLRS